MANATSRNHPKKRLLTGSVKLKDISGNNLPDQILTEKPVYMYQEGGRWGSKNIQRFTSMSCANDPQRSANWTAHVVYWNTRTLQIPWGPPQRSRNFEWKTVRYICSSLTLPKWHLATFNKVQPNFTWLHLTHFLSCLAILLWCRQAQWLPGAK